ncbi:unnamed protein product [Scytosiphon promiscuus]
MALSFHSRQSRPQGPGVELHTAAVFGHPRGVAAILSKGSIDIDRHDHTGWTALMYAARDGHSRVVQLLLNEGASVSAAGATDVLLISSYFGHLPVTKMLMKAGAEIEAATSAGQTSLSVAAQGGHSDVMRELIAGGANVDTRRKNGATPLFLSAYCGGVEAVGHLLSGGANALMTIPDPPWQACVPLDVAAQGGHSGVVRELVQQRGIRGCSGEGGGFRALLLAANFQHVDIVAMLTDAGVADTTGEVLLRMIANGHAEMAMSLLYERHLKGIPLDEATYVNPTGGQLGETPLSVCLEVSRPSSPRILRWLIDAGADTTSALPPPNMEGEVENFCTPLTFVTRSLREKKVLGEAASKEHPYALEAMRRMLLQVEAVHAVSWLWNGGASFTSRVAEDCRSTKTSSITGKPLKSMSTTWKSCRARNVLFAAAFRYLGKIKS